MNCTRTFNRFVQSNYHLYSNWFPINFTTLFGLSKELKKTNEWMWKWVVLLLSKEVSNELQSLLTGREKFNQKDVVEWRERWRENHGNRLGVQQCTQAAELCLNILNELKRLVGKKLGRLSRREREGGRDRVNHGKMFQREKERTWVGAANNATSYCVYRPSADERPTRASTNFHPVPMDMGGVGGGRAFVRLWESQEEEENRKGRINRLSRVDICMYVWCSILLLLSWEILYIDVKK